jgi:hypothetical protein
VPVVEEELDLDLTLFEEEMGEDLSCEECGSKAGWWNYHSPGRRCRSPYCSRCKREVERIFLFSTVTGVQMCCTRCDNDVKFSELKWERIS